MSEDMVGRQVKFTISNSSGGGTIYTGSVESFDELGMKVRTKTGLYYFTLASLDNGIELL